MDEKLCVQCHKPATGRRVRVSRPTKEGLKETVSGHWCDECWKKAVREYIQFDAEDSPCR